jgi:hypothetical protein
LIYLAFILAAAREILMAKFRHFLLLLMLAFSFGGFTFYASVVVPAGGAVFGASGQGFVTRRVTHAFHWSTVATMAVLIWEIAAGWSKRIRRANAAWVVCTVGIALSCAALIALHPQVDAFLLEDGFSVKDYDHFYQLHRIYLWTATIQWAFTLPIFWFLAGSGRANV